MNEIPKIYKKVDGEWSIDSIAAKLLVKNTLKLVSDLHPEIVLQLMEIIGKKQNKISDLRKIRKGKKRTYEL